MYERILSSFEAGQLEYSDLFIKPENEPFDFFFSHEYKRPMSQDKIIVIEGTDGHFYTGCLRRVSEDGGEFRGGKKSIYTGKNILRMGFRLGDKQSTEPLDKKVESYGFEII